VTVGSSAWVDGSDGREWLLVEPADEEAGAVGAVGAVPEEDATVPPADGVPAVADEQATVKAAVDSRAATARHCFRLMRSFIVKTPQRKRPAGGIS
jgi:hypothetical protein